MADNKPADSIRDGRLKATIWRNESENGTFYSTDFVRSYKDSNDDWKDVSGGFSGAELLRVSRLAEKAYERELELRVEDRE